MSEPKSCPTCWFYNAARWYHKKLDKLEAENAKLREVVDESDEELYLDIAHGLFDDLMAVDEGKAELWARAWPELFGKDEDDGSDLV